ncbi:MAG TPA: 3'-5' exonuclease, partial [Candidatus Binataceae bacterium]|nr:3'-5' exonuclease [Candidatus Binataceae bacterium]
MEHAEEILKLAQGYETYKRERGLLDYDDLLDKLVDLLQQYANVRERLSQTYRYIMIDEYQDTNEVQAEIVRLLAMTHRNVMAVGDDAQSIYSFRGANFRNILDFPKIFPGARVVKLEENYRSIQGILDVANEVISRAAESYTKVLFTKREGELRPMLVRAADEHMQSRFVAQRILELREDGVELSQIAVLFRSSFHSFDLELELQRRDIPFIKRGGFKFIETAHVKDVLAHLRVIANPADAVSLERLLGAPTRGIGARTIEVMKEMAAHEGITMLKAMGRMETARDVALRIAKAATTLYLWLHDLIGRAPELSVRAILDEIVERSGFIAYLEGMADGTQRRQNVAELLAGATEFDNQKSGGIVEYLENVALISDADAVASAGGRVALMTLHTSKGLEYPVVFIAGMEEGLFPHQRSNDNGGADIEEERRLCYVGMTRARELLYLTNTLSRELYGQRNDPRPSRFLAEIKQDLLRRIAPEAPSHTPFIRTPAPNERYVDYSESQLPEEELAAGGLGVGTQVMHPTFGRGVIRKREGR